MIDQKTLNELAIVFLMAMLIALIGALCGCAQEPEVRNIKGDKGDSAIPVLMAPASPTQCPTGGTRVMVGTQESVVCNGSNGVIGPQGPSGTPGAVGPQGNAGVAGTQITIVSFCTGVTTYPSVFVEVGLCINNNLYAVYSANDGFATLIPPGNYHSNAIGSTCNFTVGTNCQVSHP